MMNLKQEGAMKQFGRVVGSAITAYFGLMLSLYFGREVQGGSFSRFIRLAIVAYYTVMIIVFLNREVFAEGVVSPDSPRTEKGG
jgi:hypothetical protein